MSDNTIEKDANGIPIETCEFCRSRRALVLVRSDDDCEAEALCLSCARAEADANPDAGIVELF